MDQVKDRTVHPPCIQRGLEKPKNKALHKYGKERRAALSKIATAKAKLYD